MTRRLLAMVLFLMMLCGVAAQAETDNGTMINCLITEGSYVIQIDDPSGDMGWKAESEDEEIVTLYDADLIEDTFVIRFDPVQDGDTTVVVRHYTGIACDALYTWDLHVEGQAVTENASGSAAMSPDETELDPAISGDWMEQDTRIAALTVEKGEERGWDVVIDSLDAEAPFIFKTTIYYDCEVGGFVYDKGKFWDYPDDGSDDLGEAKVAGSTGTFILSDDADRAVALTWHDDSGLDVYFVREQ